MSALFLDPDARFAKYVERSGPTPTHRPELGPCWVWTGSRTAAGYGRMSVLGREQYAHRWAYERFVGPIPARFDIDHLCRNPSCVNYERHLEPVTHQVNTLRGQSPLANFARRDACAHGHEYTPANTAIRMSDGSRTCRACNRIRCRARHQRRQQLKGAAA